MDEFIVFFMIIEFIPITMLILGYIMQRKPPSPPSNNINSSSRLYVYKSKDTWKELHRFSGKLWVIAGFFESVLSIMVLGQASVSNMISYVAIKILLLQFIVMVITEVIAHIYIRIAFDSEGNRK